MKSKLSKFKLSKTTKRWIMSSLMTFLAGFLLTIHSSIDTLSLSSLQDGVFVGVLFAGFRAGIKGLIELWINPEK